MYATKEAMLAMEHTPGVEVKIFQMDMRAFGKGFDAYFERGKEKGIQYILPISDWKRILRQRMSSFDTRIRIMVIPSKRSEWTWPS
jgi:heterodisulfide reductase subunit A-like polyferredoxin